MNKTLYSSTKTPWFPTKWVNSISIVDDSWTINFHVSYFSGESIWVVMVECSHNSIKLVKDYDINDETITQMLNWLVNTFEWLDLTWNWVNTDYKSFQLNINMIFLRNIKNYIKTL